MKLVAVTSCPAGLAHTHMAAKALKKAAEKLGIEIKVETQGALGIQNEITRNEAQEADAVVLACDVTPTKSERFAGKPVVTVSVTEAMRNADGVMKRASEISRQG